MIYHNQEFFKGYVFGKHRMNEPHWIEWSIGNYFLYTDPLLTVHELHSDKHIILLGYAFDSHDITKSEQELLVELINCATDQEFHQLINRMNGRYLLFVDESGIKIYPDATTMRPLFYHTEQVLLASHSPLLAAVATHEYKVPTEKRWSRVNGFLDFSQYENIYKLNPNMYYDVTNRRPVRFFPDRPFKEQSLEDALQLTLPILCRQKDWLVTQDTFLTFTAGSDSRVSLALTKSFDIPLLTYMNTNKNMSEAAVKIYEIDERIVKEMTEDLYLNHRFIEINSAQVSRDYEKMMLQQLESKHSIALSQYLLSSPYKGKLHIKSTIYELAKLPYKRELYQEEQLKGLIRLIAKKAPKSLGAPLNFEQEVKDYIQRNELEDVDYRPFDLFYQESRMGNWHSNITQETDNSIEVFVMLNTRELLDAVIKMPLSVRENKEIHREWINALWPVLNFYPINSGPTLYECLKEYKKLEVKPPVQFKLNSQFENNENVIQPVFPFTQLENTFSVVNTAGREQTIRLFSHFDNLKAKNCIMLKVRNNLYDYTNFNEGIILKLAPQEEIEVAVIFNKLYSKPSWQKAARLTVKM